jgi:hypothetical protein
MLDVGVCHALILAKDIAASVVRDFLATEIAANLRLSFFAVEVILVGNRWRQVFIPVVSVIIVEATMRRSQHKCY